MCYRHVQPSVEMSWTDASEACRRVGGSLASLSTREVWREVYVTLRLYRSKQFSAYLGLRSSPASLPGM